ncbi:MAG: hypothetical protein GKR93_02240 [Gammaproteobacteria bacterium]|nr:hypothetical protein [Gammaproteobacteria bacterium]
MEKRFAPWLLSSKVSPPRISINASRRDNLLDLLSANIDKRVVLLEAPAGFGKTLLLSQWREVLRLEGNTVAWLSVSGNDQPDILLPYIAFALHQVGLDTEETGLLSPNYNQSDLSYLLSGLLKYIEQHAGKCILVFDDFENIPDDSLSSIINVLLRLQVANLQLVFACRKNPGMSLSSLAVEGNVLSIGPQQLVFDKNEIDHFFNHSFAHRDIDRIIERTGGWPVALQLIRSFGADSADSTNRLDINSSEKLISEYFQEQLFDNLREEEKTFLLQTSILDIVTVDCADTIRESNDSLAIIHGLDYLEGIFSSLEEDQDSWRVHPLVREYLVNSLKDSSLKDYQNLCLKAAEWMANNERGLEAMRYALTAGDPAYAAEVLEQMGGIMLWIKEGMARLTTGLNLLEGFELKQHPRIQLGRCLVHMKTGDMNSARKSYDLAKEVSANFDSDRPGGNDTQLKIESYSLQIMMAEYGCAPDNPILPDTAFTFMLDNTNTEPTIHGYIKTLQCLSSLQIGDFDNCIKHGQEAIKGYLKGHSLYGELYIYFYFGMAELARGNTAEALKQYNKATQTIQSGFPGDTGLKLLGNAVLGEYYWELGDYSKAKKHISQVITNTAEMESYFDIYMAAYQTSISFLLYEKGLKEALSFIDDALRHAKKQSLDRLEDFLLCNQLSILYLSDSVEVALELADNNPITFSPDEKLEKLSWREIEAISLTLARIARMRGDHHAMNNTLEHLILLARKTNNQRLLINLEVQVALNQMTLDEEEKAIDALSKALQLAGQGNYMRPFLNEQRFLSSIYEPTSVSMQDSSSPAEGLKLLEQLIQSETRQTTITGDTNKFSEREIQILSELSQGQADKLIARQTGLSAHGVRYHLKNIYAKMGVENRVQAISRAREMGLL